MSDLQNELRIARDTPEPEGRWRRRLRFGSNCSGVWRRTLERRPTATATFSMWLAAHRKTSRSPLS